ncbi:MAG: acyltransferase, partial [Lysobacteraceae bacterium]
MSLRCSSLPQGTKGSGSIGPTTPAIGHCVGSSGPLPVAARTGRRHLGSTLRHTTTMTRRYDIDALRVFAFALLILYPTAMAYVDDWGFH